jgi:hypothetical protein
MGTDNTTPRVLEFTAEKWPDAEAIVDGRGPPDATRAAPTPAEWIAAALEVQPAGGVMCLWTYMETR